jgi:hypothetical protein
MSERATKLLIVPRTNDLETYPASTLHDLTKHRSEQEYCIQTPIPLSGRPPRRDAARGVIQIAYIFTDTTKTPWSRLSSGVREDSKAQKVLLL